MNTSLRYSFIYIILIVLYGTILITPTIHSASTKPINGQPKPITIVIHGTQFIPFQDAIPEKIYFPISHLCATPRGLHHLNTIDAKHGFARLAQALLSTKPETFDKDRWYFYGWKGTLRHRARKRAARHLLRGIYKLKKCSPNSPITLLTHSHGGSVALLLASKQVYTDSKNKGVPLIDRLIMLACPVQDNTEHLVSSPLFGSIYHLFSNGDLMQIIDPQGLREHRPPGKDSREPGSNKPIGKQKTWQHTLFSRRVFDSKHVKHAQICCKEKPLAHVDFIKESFFSYLPGIIKKLATYDLSKPLVIDIGDTAKYVIAKDKKNEAK